MFYNEFNLFRICINVYICSYLGYIRMPKWSSWKYSVKIYFDVVLHLSRALYKLFIKRIGWVYRSFNFETIFHREEKKKCYPRYFKIFKHFNNISLSNITQTSWRPMRIPFEIIKKLSLEKFRFSFSPPHTRYNPSLPVQQRAIFDIRGRYESEFYTGIKGSQQHRYCLLVVNSHARVYFSWKKIWTKKRGLDNSRGRIVGIY